MRAEDLKDFDAAVDYYLKATKVDPHNANFQIKLTRRDSKPASSTCIRA